MRAIVCERFGGPEAVALRENWPEPEAGPGEVKVKIAARAVQYVDVLMVAGKYQFRPEPEFVPGGEAAGEIVALGEGVTGFKIGDQVMSRHTPRCLCRIRRFASGGDVTGARWSFYEAGGLFPLCIRHRISRVGPAGEYPIRRDLGGARRCRRHRPCGDPGR